MDPVPANATIILAPATEAEWLALREQDITSTESPALFDISPYETRYALWQRKRGAITKEFPDTERMKWGRRLEASIAAGVAEDLGLTIAPMKHYARHARILRMGASFDYSIEGGANIDPAAGKGVLEIKNVDARIGHQQWEVEGDEIGEAPPHIELQLQHQLEVMDRDYGYICALFGGNRLVTIYRERDRVIGAEICRRVAAFWESIATNTAPSPDFARDAGTIARLNNVAEVGKMLDWRIEAPESALDLLAEYQALGKQITETETKRDAIKARLLMLVGDAEKVITPLGSLTLSMVGPATISYDRAPYRNFRFNAVSPKKSTTPDTAVSADSATPTE